MKNLKVFLSIIFIVVFIYTANSFFLLNVKAQSSSSMSPDASDAIAVRIVPNPNHYSISRWYESQGFSGAPQALTVDGYEAIRDGRTVYINAANIDGKNIYTNIYLISYNQSSTEKTVDILGQIISHWKFNSNIIESISPVPNCAISNKNCDADNDCGDGQFCVTSGNASSSCALKTNKNCLIDADCPTDFFCNSLKSKIIRDSKRIGQLEELKEAIFQYKKTKNFYPTLGAGTYLINHSVSVWPSWSQTLLANLNVVDNFLDPINRLGNCPGFDIKTCWNNNANKFVFSPDQNYLKLPAGSYAFVYKSDPNGSNYNLCATLESRDPSLDYHFSPNDPAASACLIDTGVTTGGTATNTPPILIDKSLTGQAGQEFNGYIKVYDAENNPLTWTLSTIETIWKNWQNNSITSAPVLKETNNLNQKKIYASMAGDPGEYNISFKVDDGQGGILSTTTKIIITNSAPLIEADNGEYVLSATNPFSYSFNFYDNYLDNPATSFSVTKISGPFDIWDEAKTTAFTSIGSNKYKVTHSGIIATTHKLSQDTSFSYQIKVTDKYKVVTTKNFTIKLIVEPPVLNFNCYSKTRIGNLYSCLLGLSTSNDRKNIVYSSSNQLLANLIIKTDPLNNVSLIGTTTSLNSFNTNISAMDEYGASTTKAFSLQINNYCGDGIIQTPNSEGQGGFYNNGYEDCDGLAGISTTVASSSITKRYACSTKVGDITPDILNSNNYCTFLSVKDGGGYCGDGICSLVNNSGQAETTCNCSIDCGEPQTNCSGSTTSTTSCTYLYSDWGICQSSNIQSRMVVSSTPTGCSGTPSLSQSCTYQLQSTSCHTQLDCPSGYTCRSSNISPTLYYCTAWEGVHGCGNAGFGSSKLCVDVSESDNNFSKCQTACNGLRAVTVNGIPDSGLCTWSVQNGICNKN